MTEDGCVSPPDIGYRITSTDPTNREFDMSKPKVIAILLGAIAIIGIVVAKARK